MKRREKYILHLQFTLTMQIISLYIGFIIWGLFLYPKWVNETKNGLKSAAKSVKNISKNIYDGVY